MGACASSPERDRKADPGLDAAVSAQPSGPNVVRRSFMSVGEEDYYDAASDGGLTASEAPASSVAGPATTSAAAPSPFAAPGAGDAAYGASGPGLVRGLLGGMWARAAGTAAAVAAMLPGGGGGGAAGPPAPVGTASLPRPPPPVRAPSQSFFGGSGAAARRASSSSASAPRPHLQPTTPDGAPGVEVRPGVIVPADAVLEPEPAPAPSGPLGSLLTSLGGHHHAGDGGGGGGGGAGASASTHHHGAGLTDHAPPLGCLPVVLARLGRESAAASPRRYLRTARPPVGASLAAAPDFVPGGDVDGVYGVAPPGGPPTPGGGTSPRPVEPPGALEQYTSADATAFLVRSLDYMRTKVKAPSGPGLYRLVAADLYSFPFKINHIARHLALPPPPPVSAAHAALPPHDRLPPLLIVNIQLPTYAPALLGGPVDGPGHCLVYTFALPPGWEPPAEGGADPATTFSGPALALARRFVHNGREADGSPTRDRLKLIARVANPAQWSAEAPLNAAESRLLASYNDKPLLTRPQHKFFHGPGYLEVDLDVHQYAFLARRALASFLPRLGSVIFENALVVQGQRPEELPEAVLCAARMVRVDLTAPRPFPAELLSDDGGGVGTGDTAASVGAPLSADVLAAGRGSLLSVGGRRNSSSLAATPQAAAMAGNGLAGGGGVAVTPPPPPPPPPVAEDQPEQVTPPPPPPGGRASSAGYKKKDGRRRSSSKGGGGGKAGRKGAKAPDVVAAATGDVLR